MQLNNYAEALKNTAERTNRFSDASIKAECFLNEVCLKNKLTGGLESIKNFPKDLVFLMEGEGNPELYNKDGSKYTDGLSFLDELKDERSFKSENGTSFNDLMDRCPYLINHVSNPSVETYLDFLKLDGANYKYVQDKLSDLDLIKIFNKDIFAIPSTKLEGLSDEVLRERAKVIRSALNTGELEYKWNNPILNEIKDNLSDSFYSNDKLSLLAALKDTYKLIGDKMFEPSELHLKLSDLKDLEFKNLRTGEVSDLKSINFDLSFKNGDVKLSDYVAKDIPTLPLKEAIANLSASDYEELKEEYDLIGDELDDKDDSDYESLSLDDELKADEALEYYNEDDLDKIEASLNDDDFYDNYE